ncbi:hypothetical protein DASC09_052420 [Saccharomycopsis crataegensis]|uniref:Inner membrane assembly complex subunit 17 n=1 Tax=Saccharomycopsis crataegensis TaxID=43959 RepID=A0AAV5QSR5_9ASCO|nr:hypothetical protein DASC09_052420 [Saccharomycopsis crataegensis]
MIPIFPRLTGVMRPNLVSQAVQIRCFSSKSRFLKSNDIFNVSKKATKSKSNVTDESPVDAKKPVEHYVTKISPTHKQPITNTEQLMSQHEKNQKSINATIESLKQRIAEDPKKLEETLEELHSQSQTPKKPTLADFKWPLINTFLLTSIIYFILQYTWEYLDFEQTELEYKQQIEALELRIRELEETNEENQTALKEQKQKESEASHGWRRLFWF